MSHNLTTTFDWLDAEHTVLLYSRLMGSKERVLPSLHYVTLCPSVSHDVFDRLSLCSSITLLNCQTWRWHTLTKSLDCGGIISVLTCITDIYIVMMPAGHTGSHLILLFVWNLKGSWCCCFCYYVQLFLLFGHKVRLFYSLTSMFNCHICTVHECVWVCVCHQGWNMESSFWTFKHIEHWLLV